MFKGIHSSAKSQWLEQVDNILPELLSEPLMNNIRSKLKSIADSISGIGSNTIDETLVNILEKQNKIKRGF